MTKYILVIGRNAVAYQESNDSLLEVNERWSKKVSETQKIDEDIATGFRGVWIAQLEDVYVLPTYTLEGESSTHTTTLKRSIFEKSTDWTIDKLDKLPEVWEFEKKVFAEVDEMRQEELRKRLAKNEIRDMTLAEIEKELGYKVRIVS